MERTYWNQPGLDDPNAYSNNGDSFKAERGEGPDYDFGLGDSLVTPARQLVYTPEEANLVSSFTRTGKQAPVIDIDVPCKLVPSKTPGHFHLYIDVEMDTYSYMTLLSTMARCGIVEWNYATAAQRAGMSFVRSNPESRPDRVPAPNEDRMVVRRSYAQGF